MEQAVHEPGRDKAHSNGSSDLVNEIVGSNESVDPMFITLSVMNQWDRAAYWYNPKGKRTPEEAVDQMLILTARLLGLADVPVRQKRTGKENCKRGVR